ncbi:MAG: type II toxin-antitoxin system RelE/ParE family toxin [Verrucomicrobiales bacterium]|nr:type II toxin-antitoxin system RelE/ParE family toxin [Verrucomicrobiales bacterium]
MDFTDAAIGDLRSIRNYTLEKWGEEQEAKYLDELWNRFEEIQTNPQRWRSREDLFPGCQLAPYERHVILFRIEDGTLRVVRVLHSAMDFQRHIPENL